jgi:elongation factor Ts
MSSAAEQIKELRQISGAGVLDCRNALQEAGGDVEKAAALLRERGLDRAAKRADRAADEGLLDIYLHGDGRVGVIVEVNCETDFVARTEEFRTFVHEVALQVAATDPQWVAVDDVPEAKLQELRETYREDALREGKREEVVDKIVDGRLKKYLKENCLLEQQYIRDEDKPIRELLQDVIVATGEKIVIRRFMRWSLGEHNE